MYPLTRTARNKLLTDNLTLRQKTVQVYEKNPFIVRGGSGEEVPVTKVWISDIPMSVDGKHIETALVRLGCVLRSSLINEKIRNTDRKLTRFLTGRRLMFVNIPERPLERMIKIGGFTARLYHKEQPRADPQRTTCSRCLERGHRLCHKEQPRADPQRTTCSRCSERGHRLCHKNSRGPIHSGLRAPGAWREVIACVTRNSRGLTHSGQRAPGARREAIACVTRNSRGLTHSGQRAPGA